MPTAIRESTSTLLLILFVLSVHAQKDAKKYKDEAEVFRKEVWNWNKPEFNVRTIPASFNSASKVVIARHVQINADSKTKAGFTETGFGVYKKLFMTQIAREALKINDKSALDDYSQFSFTQIQKRSGVYLAKTTSTYMGVRIIKSNGTVKEINADDFILTKDEKNLKETKLAIPDLQVGDILDYFIAKQTDMGQNFTSYQYVFDLFEDCPVMSFSIHAEIGKKYAVEYRSYNGAQDFQQTRGEDDANVLDLEKKDIPAFAESEFWVSPYRQLPLIRMNIILGYSGINARRYNMRKPGEVYKNQNVSEFVEDKMVWLAERKKKEKIGKSDYYLRDPDLDDYQKSLKKKWKDMPVDSQVMEMYYMYRYNMNLTFYTDDDVQKQVDRGKEDYDGDYFAMAFGEYMKDMDIDNKLVFISSKDGPPFNELMTSADIHYLNLVQGSKGPLFFGRASIFSPAFYIPFQYENLKKATVVDTKGIKENNHKNYETSFVDLPVTTAKDNQHRENLAIQFNNGLLQVKRKTTLTGHYKTDDQKRLILMEDFCNAERKAFGLQTTLIEDYSSHKSTRDYAAELKVAFDKARLKQKDAFIDEAKEWFEMEVKDLTGNKVDNMGVRHTSPDLSYSSSFSLDGAVKKAGNNFTVEIGKLQGPQPQIKPEQRNRTLDIYMPFARTTQTEISFQIPEGYSVEGVEALNKKIENECGSFVSTASADGKTLTINIKRMYNNSFEKASNWSKLLAILDATSDWGNSKLLLKKK
jgi:hypothetical protein